MRHLAPIGVVALFFTLLASGCSWFKDNATIVDNVEPEFNLDLVEKLDAPFRPIQIRVATIKKQNCKAIIHNTAVRSGRTILFNIHQWNAGEPCTEELSIRDTLIPIDVLTPGSYELKVRIAEDLYSDGILTVAPDRYLFECPKPLGFLVDRTEMLRIPDGLIWGYIGFTNSYYAKDADDLVTELRDLNQEANIRSGNYGHFIMENRNTVTLPYETPNFAVTRTFVLREQLTEDEITNWVNHLRRTYLDKISIYLVNSQGKIWN